jgi:HAD superfamily phosphoserine phosphatase-like hydrolase
MNLIVSDLEGTLTAGASWRGIRAYFQEFHSRWTYDRFLLGWLPRYLLIKVGLLNRKKAMDSWMKGEIKLLCGERPQAINMMAEWVVVNEMWPQRRVDVLAKLEDHRRKGAQIVIVSGAYQPIVEVFARRIGDVKAIGSRLIYENGRLSGLALPINSYQQKAENIRTFCGDEPVLAAYGDTISDLPMLEMSQQPTAVYPDDTLRRVAESRDWHILG